MRAQPTILGLKPYKHESPRRRLRAHLTADGAPKRAYRSKEVAEFVADDIATRGPRPDPYLCPDCRQWHLGRWRGSVRKRQPVPEEFYVELGGRVAGCIRAENVGSSDNRLRQLAKRGTSAARKRTEAA